MANPLTLTITERDEDGCKRPFLVTDDPEVIRAVAAALGRRLGADSPERRQLAAQLPGETRTTLEKLDAVAAAPGATEPERATAARRAAFLRRKAAERGES
jgi:hypothetical protein